MTFDTESKWKAIEDLQAIHRNGQILEIHLRFAGRDSEAEKVWSENVRLGQEIDLLIGRAIDQWLGESTRVLAKIARASQRLQAAIDDVQGTIKAEEGVVKAIGYIDDAAQIAAKLAKYV